MTVRISLGGSNGALSPVCRRMVRGALGSIVATSLLATSATQGFAQTQSQQQTASDSQYVPQGSPVVASDAQQRVSENQSESYPDPVSGEGFRPTEVQDRESSGSLNRTTARRSETVERNPRLKPPAAPNEFERFVERVVGRKLPRFGADLLLPSNRDYAVPATATVPPSYVINPGDVIGIAMTGSIEGSVEREVDTNGRIFLPQVGQIRIAGVPFRDLKSRVAQAIGVKYRGFDVSVSIRELRGIRVYVTGFANNPGAYSVNSLSTLVNAVLAAGGPSSGGSFRSIKLYRNNELIRDFDLYDMLLRGDRANDAVLQNEDVILIEPVGREVAVTGSVNQAAVFEIKPGETIEQLLAFSGGPNSLADKDRLFLYRMSNYDTIGAQQIGRVNAASMRAEPGDIVQILSAGTLLRSTSRQSVIVRIEGEVNAPGSYYLPAGTPLAQVLARAGGLTDRAFVYGTRYERASVRQQQRESFKEAVEQLEIQLAATPLTSSQLGADVSQQPTQIASAREVLNRLRNAEPDGRIVLGLTPSTTTLPADFILENNDRIVVPARPVTVGVFGAVYRPASFVIDGARPQRVKDYLDRAGGPLRAADQGATFVVRANGDVVSKRRGALSAAAQPGDVIFVPIRTQGSSIWAKVREISTIVFQLGLSAATIAAISN